MQYWESKVNRHWPSHQGGKWQEDDVQIRLYGPKRCPFLFWGACGGGGGGGDGIDEEVVVDLKC